MDDKQLFSLLKIILCIAIYIYLLKYFIYTLNPSNLNIPTYVINLKRRKDRLLRFKKNYSKSKIGMPLLVHEATDGKSLNLNELNISKLALKEIYNGEKLGYRTRKY